MFDIEFSKELTRKMAKIKKKNKVMFEAVINKIREIKDNPEHYKPLKYDLKGYRRVHIIKSFELIGIEGLKAEVPPVPPPVSKKTFLPFN